MMDLEDGIDSTPGLLGGSQVRLAPFLGANHPYATDSKAQQAAQQTASYCVTTTTTTSTSKQLQQQCSVNGGGQMTLTQRHNSALAVSIETDV